MFSYRCITSRMKHVRLARCQRSSESPFSRACAGQAQHQARWSAGKSERGQERHTQRERRERSATESAARDPLRARGGDARSKPLSRGSSLSVFCLARDKKAAASAALRPTTRRTCCRCSAPHGITATERCARQLIRASFSNKIRKIHPQSAPALFLCWWRRRTPPLPRRRPERRT